MGLKSLWTKVYETLASVRTGILLIIAVGIFSALGTVILQRPTSEPDQMARSYSPETLALLDRLGLTDIFHAWWFIVLLCLFCLCLIFVSLDRWPNAWKVYAHPLRFVPPALRASQQQKMKIPVKDEAAALSAAERVLGRFGLKAGRVNEGGATGLFAESQRFSVLAVYLVHLSLLFIFAGYILDGIVGYRGSMNIPEGQTRNQIMVSDNRGGTTRKTIPFMVRCDAAGEETYADGSPKKWWSKLTVLEDNREVLSKTIVVNDPLTYRGLRFYQSSMGQSGTPRTLTFEAAPVGKDDPTMVELPLNGSATLPDGEKLSILRWVPDYYVQDNQVFNKSDDPENPAVQLGLTNGKGETKKLWILYSQMNSTRGQDAPYEFALKHATWEQYTGLEVSHQPGQFGVWIGVVLMAIGLVIAFYTQHARVWVAVETGAGGGKVLWVGGSVNKNRERFQAKFAKIKAALEQELGGAIQEKEESTLAKA